MPVAIRKRSWEEHVTHRSGLQYSYDDLDLVCCHGVGTEGSWMGSGSSKQGQRTRCFSMPECCHQLPTYDLAQALEWTTSVESKHLEIVGGNAKVMLDFQEKSVDGSQVALDDEHLLRSSQSGHLQDSEDSHCCSNGGTSHVNIASTDYSSRNIAKTIDSKSKDGTESSKNNDIFDDDNVFTSVHMSGKEQCTSIYPDNGPPLSDSTGKQSGKCPKSQGTMESPRDGHSSSLEPSEAIPTQLEPHTVLAQNEISTTGHGETSGTLPAGAVDCSFNLMKNDGVMSKTNNVVELTVTVMVEEEHNNGEIECRRADPADEFGELNDTKTLNENKESNLDSQDIKQDHQRSVELLNQGDEESKQPVLDQNNADMPVINQVQGEERAHTRNNKMASEKRTYEATSLSGMWLESQCSSQEIDIGNSELDQIQEFTNTVQYNGQNMGLQTFISQPMENINGSKMSTDLSSSDVLTTSCQGLLENGCSILDTIHEVNLSEADDGLLLQTQNHSTSDCAHTSVLHVYSVAHENNFTKQQNQKKPSCAPDVNDELSLERHDGHQAACYSGESSASLLEDGQKEHQRPGATSSKLELKEEAAQTFIYNETHANPDLDGTSDLGDQNESITVKLRVKKHENSRLDSMVLLLMKLDQLDQEIENALSATSSMDSTPTPHRRQLLDMDLGSILGVEASLDTYPPHQHNVPVTMISSSEPPPALGAKPKSGTISTIPEKEKSEIEAKEACTWLRAAGFPQYAQLYEDAQFPIDISSVTRDHDFLDRDAIEALCRRLNTLNKCALMRLEISPQRKRSEDSDEDEPCAISGRWTFQRDSKRWSRMDELEVFSSLHTEASQPSFPQQQGSQAGKLTLCEGHSSESVLTDVSEQPEVGSIHSSGSGDKGEEKSQGGALVSHTIPAGATRASSMASMCSSSGTGGSGCANEDSLSDGLPPSPLETLGQFTFDVKIGVGGVGGSLDRGVGDGKSTRSRAKSFLKRMESLRIRSSSTSKRKKKLSTTGGKLEISGPVVREGLDDDKLRRLNCVDISNINLNHHQNPGQTMTLNRNRSVSYSTQTSNGSTGSTGSSQSEASSGSAVSTPSPVTRARSHSTVAGSSKRGGMYLEGFDPLSIIQNATNQQLTSQPKSAPPIPCQQNRRNNCSIQDNTRQAEEEDEEEEDMILFYLPEGHKPGTFPKALQDGNTRNKNGSNHGNSVILRGHQNRRHRRGSAGSVDSRLSFYDNVPYTGREEEEEEDEGGDEHKLEEVLQHVSGLQRFVNAWSEAVDGEEEEDEEEEGDSDSALDSASPCPSSPLQNRLEENGSDQDSTGNPLGEGEEGMRERRDSGVGASLTRTNRPQKLRWPSFQNSHRPSLASAQLQIGCQSVLQMNLLQKFSLLQLTALLERHTPTNKHGFSWAVPKFMKRTKVRDYKDRNVFGVPLQVIVQRTGQPLPQGIQQAMRYLRNQCLDQVGLFRKSGVKSRIQALRQMNEACGADGGGINYEGQSAYDVADMLKQYFRDLPEPLLTSKLSETFIQIYQYMPKELRLQAARAAVLLLPDENREALQMLLCLLSDVTACVSENQMTPTNLAVCLAPSLFHLNTLRRKESSSPRKQTLGKPDQRDLNENLAATHGLAHMIQECRKLFRIPEEMSRCRNSYVEQALLPQRLEELGEDEAGPGGYRTYLRDNLEALFKEAKDKFKGYDSCSTPEHAELAYRKMHDGSPLRLWKVTVEVPASPEEVLTRVLREQARWDEDLLESRVVETLDERTEVYQYVRNTMAPHPTRDHLVLRTWVSDLPKGACALVCTSVDHEGAPVLGVRANVLTSRYFIDPCGANKSRLTYISRTDFRGRFPEWYNKLYGHLCAAEVVRIRDSFTVPTDK
ncbi:rho GTPase-activating protein 7 isoform X2 [Lampris incognitus]|uniref:rho GTPase-activating protein 7 isoform X2 n=1 Tax=Lampris incognitus TaxID=2546036 RepID=UPI0024B57744|nr:rho GTPase-activating protein 7 isoform X2 [Lampris incognitus]